MQKWYPKSDEHGLQQGPQKRAKITKMGSQSPLQNRVPKKHQKMIIFSTPECGQSVVNRSKIDEFQLLVLTPAWVSFWRCFGSPNGGQGHQKATSKNIQKMMPNMTPNWSQMGSQNGAQIVKNEVLEAPCFKGGSQEASRALPGWILEGFVTILGPFSSVCLTYFW